MRRLAAALLAALAFAAAGCSAQHAASSATAQAPRTARAAETPAPAHSGKPTALAFGTTAAVEGGTGAFMHMTPFAAWWLTSGGTRSDETQPGNGYFLIVEFRLSPEGAPATFPAPLTGDGPEVISDGRVLSDAGDSASDNVVWNTCLPVIDSTTTMEPGDTLTDGETYDVPAQSGELRWQDANGSTVTWTLPARDTGPLPAAVRQAIGSGNGC